MANMTIMGARKIRDQFYPDPAGPDASTSLVIALYTSDPTVADIGTEVSTSGTGYSRQTYWPASVEEAADVKTHNTYPIAWTAIGNWGIITHVGIRYVGSYTNPPSAPEDIDILMFFKELGESITVNNGDSVGVDLDSLTFKVS